MLDLSGARATATPCAPEEMRRRVGAGDVGRVVPRVLEYLERGEALAEGRRHGEIAGVYKCTGPWWRRMVEHHGLEGRHGDTWWSDICRKYLVASRRDMGRGDTNSIPSSGTEHILVLCGCAAFAGVVVSVTSNTKSEFLVLVDKKYGRIFFFYVTF